MINVKIKNQAIALRRKGYSIKEISKKLPIAQSTASLWLRDIELSEKAKERIMELGNKGRDRGLRTNTERRALERLGIEKEVTKHFSSGIQIDSKIACALLYWGEGTKYPGNHSVSFMNADPAMIRYFLNVFRRSFALNEKKLRALVHLHEYHDVEKQQMFWSEVAGIPLAQFNRAYIKPNTGKNKKEHYPGCISIRYSDSRIYKEIMYIIEKLGTI
jgi:hypothetical protein